MQLLSPAKLNLFFRVLSKRRDGYHNIASLYSKINLYDTLHIELSKVDRFTYKFVPPLTPVPDFSENNLVQKAIDLFRGKTAILTPIAVHLEKRIPLQAGLGGGSSNAATTLLGLNTLFNLPLSDKDLLDLASQLGSDVPFFLGGQHAYCTSRGENIQEVALLASYPLFVAKPRDLALSTPLVYKNCIPGEATHEEPEALLKAHLSGNPRYINDLEPAAFRVLPDLATIKQKLLSLGFESVSMTGSGTAFFCRGDVRAPQLDGVDFYPVSI